jgi:NADH dehydrogenase
MKVAVLGASGFVGKRIIRRLLADGFQVVAMARRATCKSHHHLTKVQIDLVRETPDFSGCAAVVNAVGIKEERGPQTFEAVHVGLVEKLIDAMRSAGVRRLIHISVVGSGSDAYHATKRRSEEIIEKSGLDYTILRPGVIYGPGDDMLTHLTKMIRTSPVFPIVGRGTSELQPVYVEDVALAVSRALFRSVLGTFDVVGPERLTLRTIVERVAEALHERVHIVPTPSALLMAVPNTLATPSQVRMLIAGMTGDVAPMREKLDVHPRPFLVELIREIVEQISYRPAVHLRIGETWPTRINRSPLKLSALLSLSLGLLTAAFLWDAADPWTRLVTAIAALGPLGLAAVWNERRELMKPDGFGLLLGVAVAAICYGPVWPLTRWDPVAIEAARLYEWKGDHSMGFLLATLVVAVLAEELFWRAAVTRLFAHALSQWSAVLIGSAVFAVWHLASGSWLLVGAALAMGIVWSTLFVLTRNLSAALACHLVWDLLVFLVAT